MFYMKTSQKNYAALDIENFDQ